MIRARPSERAILPRSPDREGHAWIHHVALDVHEERLGVETERGAGEFKFPDQVQREVEEFAVPGQGAQLLTATAVPADHDPAARTPPAACGRGPAGRRRPLDN